MIRGHAAWALGQIGDEEAKKALQEMLEYEKNEETLQEIRCALDEFL
jgi:epoxyqueuosine reductase